MRRATQTRRPNQRTCSHKFFKLDTRHETGQHETDPVRLTAYYIAGRSGVELGCAKCGLIRTIWSDGTLVDGPRVPRREMEQAYAGGTANGTITYPTTGTLTGTLNNPIAVAGSVNVQLEGRTAAQRMDAAAGRNEARPLT